MNQRSRIVVSGMGCVSPNGVGSVAFGAACRDGVSGIKPLTISTKDIKSTVAASVDLDLSAAMSGPDLRRVPRMIPLAMLSAREALAQAKLDVGDDIEKQRSVATILGTGGGGLAFVENQYETYYTAGKHSPFAITAGTHGNLSSELSIQLHLRGPSHVITSGCTSSTDAIGYAMLLLNAGVVDSVLVGGADAPIARGILMAFESMHVVTTKHWPEPSAASRPFDAGHDGFVLGEGAWFFVVERQDVAEARGATPLAELAGYASTCDAFHRVRIAPDTAECVRAMQLALGQAGVTTDELDYVNLHGTATPLNDTLETLAMHRLLGDRATRVPMSSTKSMIGHPQGACGAAGLAATILGMHGGWIHPTINLASPAQGCDLDYVPNTHRDVPVKTALCNCIAFGSKNSALVVRRW